MTQIDQFKVAQVIVEQINEEVGSDGVSVLDLLDILATLGLEFAVGAAASEAYFKALAGAE